LDQGTHLIGSSAYDLNLLPPTGTATHQNRNTFEFFSFIVKRFPCIANQTIDHPSLAKATRYGYWWFGGDLRWNRR
jgi:hypothetical protein